MNTLRWRALARLPMTEATVRDVYEGRGSLGPPGAYAKGLCESHERLRAELQGAECLLEDLRREVFAVVTQMDEMAARWGDEAGFRRCRDRLRNLLPVPDQLKLPPKGGGG